MFFNSTQKQSWTFKTEEEIDSKRTSYLSQYREDRLTDFDQSNNASPPSLLTEAEENLIIRYYEQRLQDFCHNFSIYDRGEKKEGVKVPLYVLYTSINYFKRIYLENSVMDFEPRLTFLTCVWLAMKVEEFNTKIDEFCYNCYESKEKAVSSGQQLIDMGDEILSFELIIMKAMSYNLIVHSPFRPLEGFILDINNYNLPHSNGLDMTPLFKEAYTWLLKILKTKIPILYSPSQITIASLAIGSKNLRKTHPKIFKNFGDYMTFYLLPRENKRKIIQNYIKSMAKILKNEESKEEMKIENINLVKSKLMGCRNQLFNPRSKEFKKKIDDSQSIQFVSQNNDGQQIAQLKISSSVTTKQNAAPAIPARRPSSRPLFTETISNQELEKLTENVAFEDNQPQAGFTQGYNNHITNQIFNLTGSSRMVEEIENANSGNRGNDGYNDRDPNETLRTLSDLDDERGVSYQEESLMF